MNSSNTVFKETSEVMFTKNIAIHSSGAAFSVYNASITFKGNSIVVFYDNQAKGNGGAICFFVKSLMVITENSSVAFDNNRAQVGGAIHFSNQSNYTINDHSLVSFSCNSAVKSGGSIFIANKGVGYFKGNSMIQFNSNRADCGAAVMSSNATIIMFQEQAKVIFMHNIATVIGGAIKSVVTSDVFFTQYSMVLFYDNIAQFGESIFTEYDSAVTITVNSTVKFNNNTARWYGGVPYSNEYGYSDISFDSNGTVTCSDPETLPVCIHQSCFCQVIDNVLASLTSNVQIDLSINVTLSSIITLTDLNNISIIGHHNPTINCSNAGGVKFTSCHNCTIEGITWNGCGNKNIHVNTTPVIEFYHSTNITIQNCTFQYSIGQAVALSEVSGSVKITHCWFLHNNHYEGNGAAVHLSSLNNLQNQFLFIISNCDFRRNERSKSIIYIILYGNKPQLLFLSDTVFSGNQGTPLHLSNNNIYIVGNVIFDNNTAEYGAGIVVSNHSTITFSNNSTVTFNHNTANNSGGAIYLHYFSSAIFEDNCFIIFHNNIAKQYYGGSISLYEGSKVVLTGNSFVQFNKNAARVRGGALYIETNSSFVIEENSSVIFYCNKAESGGAVYFTDSSTVLFKGNAHKGLYYDIIKWHDAAMLFHDTYIFTNKTMTVAFINNTAIQGGTIYLTNESILHFKSTALVNFIHNEAKIKGGAISCSESSNILFEDKSCAVLTDNRAEFGGAVYIEDNSVVLYKGNCSIEFIGNGAEQNGGAVYYLNSKEDLQENPTIKYTDNRAKGYGGAVYFSSNSNASFDEHSRCVVTFHNNEATQGGAVYCETSASITLGGQSKVIFTNNNATFGGAVYCYNNTIITTRGYSCITFANNTALEQGSALVIKQNSKFKLKENSTAIFGNNIAVHNGGSIFLEMNSVISFEEHCTVTFDNNTADDGTGGAISSNTNSAVEFKDNSNVKFQGNDASQGGAIHSTYNSSLIFCKNTTVSFDKNNAAFGGALNFYSYSFITFQGDVNSTIKFDSNKATQNGGAVYLQRNSNVIFEGTLTVKFHNNEATLGGAIHCNSNSGITSTEAPNITFSFNTASLGGAIYTMTSNITIADNSKLEFTHNIALQDGGALFLDKQFRVILTGDAEITFSFNTASEYGGAIYSRVDQSVINFNVTNINFYTNHARTAGSSVFINVPTLSNSSCLHISVLGVNKQHDNELSKHITTSPRKLELYKPAVCIDYSNVECNSYFVKNIMLGQEILIDACMYDYYDRPTQTEEFIVSSADDQDYYIPGSQYILISCNHTFEGISIVGNNITPVLPFNYSMTIALYVVRKSEMKTISVTLTAELSECHPGFWYHNTSWKCECYNSTNILFCSGTSSSIIKRGYWFGSVTGKPTVTFCPINYCNFTCCETTNGYYHLSPVRDNQCMLHRSGTACGNCDVGYSLSFDSTDCIDATTCTIGQTILLIILMIVYWLTISVAVFVMMYFRIEIGYFYGITYYILQYS